MAEFCTATPYSMSAFKAGYKPRSAFFSFQYRPHEMTSSSTFASWLGTLFRHSELQVRRLLDDGTALHFLVAWSLFESKCFSGFVKAAEIASYAERVAPRFGPQAVHDAVVHFYQRYQHETLFRNLMHRQKDERLSGLLEGSMDQLSPQDKVYFVVFVIHRFRNNIFHGNKGVDSWLKYRQQIQYCVEAMQVLVSDAEHAEPTMNAEAA